MQNKAGGRKDVTRCKSVEEFCWGIKGAEAGVHQNCQLLLEMASVTPPLTIRW